MSYTATQEKYWLNGSGTSNAADNAPSTTGLRKHPYYIYLVVNELTGTTYVGQHRSNPDESWRAYMGSGSYLKTEAKAYGVENFSKKLLAWAENGLEAKFIEARFIAKALGKPTYCYNSNQAEAVRRDPIDNLRHFSFKASFRGRQRLQFNVALTESALTVADEPALIEELTELLAGWRFALQIKDERFAATNRLDPKDWAEDKYGFNADDTRS